MSEETRIRTREVVVQSRENLLAEGPERHLTRPTKTPKGQLLPNLIHKGQVIRK